MIIDETKLFITAIEVTKLLGIGRSRAYDIISVLNKKLDKAGKLTLPGKINREYFLRQIDCSDVA